MSKYSKEFKLEVVKYYLQEHHSYSECCKKFNIPSMTPIKQWVDKYQLYGVEGIFKNLKSSYDGNFKQNVVEYMHTNHLSATETANYFKLGNHSVVLKWERIYYEEGPQGLYIERRGRNKNMNGLSTLFCTIFIRTLLITSLIFHYGNKLNLCKFITNYIL